jgi:hypothetical protein
MLPAIRRARSPSQHWSSLSPQQVWRRARGTWDCRCEHEPQIQWVARSGRGRVRQALGPLRPAHRNATTPTSNRGRW